MGSYALRGNWDEDRKGTFIFINTMKSGFAFHYEWLALPSQSKFKWYGDSGEQGIGMHEMEVSPLIIGCDWMPSNTIGCHQIRQQLFLLHIPCSHQRLITHPSIPLLSRPSWLKHLLVVSIFVPSSLQQTPQSTQSLISLFVLFTPGVFSVLISVVYTICALRVDDCRSSLPHLFRILPLLHEY